jgi:hypothetical protein
MPALYPLGENERELLTWKVTWKEKFCKRYWSLSIKGTGLALKKTGEAIQLPYS